MLCCLVCVCSDNRDDRSLRMIAGMMGKTRWCRMAIKYGELRHRGRKMSGVKVARNSKVVWCCGTSSSMLLLFRRG